jgi:predicted dehydrogenase
MTPSAPAADPRPVRVLMVAIGGYGFHYLRAFWDHVPRGTAVLAGVVDPWARSSPIWPEVEAAGVPVADTMEAFYGSGHAIDLAVVVSPIHAHVPQSLVALAHGSHVLCDKPIGATIQEARALIAARARAGRLVFIGYQWSFSTAIQSLKRDLLAGRFGQPRRLVTVCAWPRGMSYYRRNRWAGRLTDADTGAWVLDSPANNAMAHFLHNALFLLGPALDRSAQPAELQGELYRALPIESADTAACRIRTDTDAEVLFLASHATELAIDPRFRLECDDAVITYGEHTREIIARSLTGTAVSYGDPDGTSQFQKLFVAIEAARPGAEPAVPPVVCGPEAAMAHTLAVNGLHESARDIVPFPAEMIGRPEVDRTAARGLREALLDDARAGRLPSESGRSWARAGRVVRLEGYEHYPGGSVSPGSSTGAAR